MIKIRERLANITVSVFFYTVRIKISTYNRKKINKYYF